MRIIGGKAGGLRLNAGVGKTVRPTEDRVKESLFSILGELSGLVVWDLFSGTGALGLEALSRGASQVVLVEREAQQAAAIRENLASLCRLCPECQQRAVLVNCDVANLGAQLAALKLRPAQLILADPPYHPAENEYGGAKLLQDASLQQFLAADCRLALEHETGTTLPWNPFSPWRLRRQKSCGIRTLSFAEYQEEKEEDEW